MKVFCVLLLFAVIANANPVSNSSPSIRRFNLLHREPPPPTTSDASGRIIQSLTITQKVDQFDETNTDTWEMRYYSNNEHYVPGGPLFIYVGGEWTISYGWVTGGHMYDMAKEMNGYIFYTEHRYYGQSYPTSDASTANLKYLDVDQALADLAHFVDYQRANIPGAANAGVVLVGGSYSATMVAWFRQKYPDKANGVWASSAPLMAQLDFPEYKDVMTSAIASVGGSACSNRIQDAFGQMEAQIASGQVTSLTEKFNLCSDIIVGDDLDIWNFFAIVTDEFAGLVQYHWTGDIERACAAITDSSIADPVEAVGKWVQQQFQSECVDTNYQSFIDYYKETAWGTSSTSSAMRQWIYQTCNEFGWYQTDTSDTQIFGKSFPLDLNIRMCADLYDEQFTSLFIEDRIQETNNNHNGMTPAVTNVFFTHGEIDPWRPMGVQADVNADSPVVILDGHSHCSDLYSISSSDTDQMRNTKLNVTAHVRKWLGMN